MDAASGFQQSGGLLHHPGPAACARLRAAGESASSMHPPF